MDQVIEEARARGDLDDTTVVFTWDPSALSRDPYDWATEVDPNPTGIPAHWWALGALASTIAGAVDRATRFRHRWWWPWPWP